MTRKTFLKQLHIRGSDSALAQDSSPKMENDSRIAYTYMSHLPSLAPAEIDPRHRHDAWQPDS